MRALVEQNKNSSGKSILGIARNYSYFHFEDPVVLKSFTKFLRSNATVKDLLTVLRVETKENYTDYVNSVSIEYWAPHVRDLGQSFFWDGKRLFANYYARLTTLEEDTLLEAWKSPLNGKINLKIPVTWKTIIIPWSGFIFIRSIKNEVTLEVDSTDTIETVKLKYQDVTCERASEQHLLFSGRELDDNKTLSYYKITDGTRLEISLRPLWSTFAEERSVRTYCSVDPPHPDNPDPFIQIIIRRWIYFRESRFLGTLYFYVHPDLFMPILPEMVNAEVYPEGYFGSLSISEFKLFPAQNLSLWALTIMNRCLLEKL